MENRFATALLSVDVIRRALEILKLNYRLIITSPGQMKLFVQIPNKPKEWEERFWDAIGELIGPDGEEDTGVLRPFDPDAVRFVTGTQVREDLFLNHLFYQQKEPVETLALPHLDRWLHPEEGSPGPVHKRPGRIVFYSYKGGLGRTTALILCALALANRGRRVALIDLDLEAPGLASTLFHPGDIPRRGVVDYLLGYPAIANWDEVRIKKYLRKHVPTLDLNFAQGGTVAVWGAGQVDTAYAQKLAHITLEHVHRQRRGDPIKRMFELVDQVSPGGLDYILIDSRTGLADIGGSLLYEYADVVCGLFHANPQTQDGMRICVNQWLRDGRTSRQDAPDLIWIDSHTRPVQDPGVKTAQLRLMLSEILDKATEPEVHRLSFIESLVDLSPQWFHRHAGAALDTDQRFAEYVVLADRLEQMVAARRRSVQA